LLVAVAVVAVLTVLVRLVAVVAAQLHCGFTQVALPPQQDMPMLLEQVALAV
jgi:hypothetical protein